eukprot:3927362-Pleurochrysis_carterae.AAC.1
MAEEIPPCKRRCREVLAYVCGGDAGSGGQGHVHCLYKGACAGKMSSCFRAGRKCNSHSHEGNVKCKSYDDTE